MLKLTPHRKPAPPVERTGKVYAAEGKRRGRVALLTGGRVKIGYQAGIKLLRERRPDVLYLSLTDWVQHKWAPSEDGAREFYRRLDDCVGRLAALDATVALTGQGGLANNGSVEIVAGSAPKSSAA